MTFKILQGDNRDTLKTLADNSIDAIVTDPPYGISFLGKDWDSFRNSKVTKNSTVKNLGSGMRMTTAEENLNFQLWCEEWAKECFRVLKPGGYILSFCAARMYHRMTVGLEDAGFEIRDQIMWIYSSGFPKSQDIGRSIQRKLGVKETKSSKGMNAYAEVKDKKGKEKWMNPGNVTSEDYPEKKDTVVCTDPEAQQWQGWGTCLKPGHEPIALARKPTKLSYAENCQQWGTGGLNIDACRIPVEGADTRSGGSDGWDRVEFGQAEPNKSDGDGYVPNDLGRFPSNVIGEIQEEYQKYFYCPKVSRKERHIGFDDPGPMFQGSRVDIYQPNKDSPDIQITSAEKKDVPQNNHPTVKPVALMEYLIKLITPPGGTVLDPFNGSGSTGMAAVGLGFNYIGCELDPAYVDIAEKRIAAWLKKDNNFSELFVDATE